MLDICLLGTGGTIPRPERWLTAMMCRLEGSNLLIDCGEGTQMAIAEKGLSVNPIDIICITHIHADHVAGLPGLLLTMAKSERTEPVTIIGPKGIKDVVNALCTIAPGLPFKIIVKELNLSFEIIQFGLYEIHAFRVIHSVPCYGYSIIVNRAAKFLPDQAKKLGIPVKLWNRLQHGHVVKTDDATYTPDMVLGKARKGLKVVYCTDTRPCEAIVSEAHKADLLICEGMYGEKEKIEKAKTKRHMMMSEAADIAKEAKVKELWLTHYSPSMMYPENFMKNVCKVFPNTVAAKDGRSTTLCFED